jgi:hypothetical protein
MQWSGQLHRRLSGGIFDRDQMTQGSLWFAHQTTKRDRFEADLIANLSELLVGLNHRRSCQHQMLTGLMGMRDGFMANFGGKVC